MESPNAGTLDKVVAVAVKKGKHSQSAVKWTVENLAEATKSLLLIHAKRKSVEFGSHKGMAFEYKYNQFVHVCGEEVARGLEQSYKETLNLQAKEMFQPLTSYCKKKNVHYEEVIIEDDDIIQGIADYVLKNNVDVLVLGAGSRGGLFRRLRGPDTASKIAKSAPYFCTVYTIAKGSAVSIKSASTSAQSLLTLDAAKIQEPDIGNHVQFVSSQMEPRISVSAGESLLPPRPVNEFEFRSPMEIQIFHGKATLRQIQTYHLSALTGSSLIVHPPVTQLIAQTSALVHLIHGRHLLQLVVSLSLCLQPGLPMHLIPLNDELRRLQLELMQTKKMYEAACQDALDAKMQASKMKPHDLEDGDEMNRMQGSAVTLSKLENDKDETAARITNITKRIAELKAQQTC